MAINRKKMFGSRTVDVVLPFHTLNTLRIRIGWFVNLRWIAVFAILSAIPIGQRMFQFDIAYSQIFLLSAVLIILNLVYFFLFKYFPFQRFRQELVFTEIQLIGDLIIISFLIHYAGGLANPFFFLYVVHIIISGILFQGSIPYINTLLVAILLTTWTILEYVGAVDVYLIEAAPMPLSLIITTLIAFYILIFTVTYVLEDFLNRYRTLHSICDMKGQLLEKTMIERDKMFRFTAHELKSPLTTLRSMLSVLDELYADKMPPEARDMITRAVQRNDQVLLMVKDMIEIAQIKQGMQEKILLIVDYEEALARIIEPQGVYARDKKIDLVIEPANQKASIYIDVPSLEKIVVNLVHNAIRYSSEGAKVTVKPFSRPGKFGLTVIDTGIGIAEEDLGKIFDEFFRGKNAKLKEKLGTGLGLSLVKQLVEQMGGQIAVSSQLGVGSQFTVEIPKRAPSQA